MTIFPYGIQEVMKEYGNPRLYMRPDGTIHHSWEQLALGMCILPAPLQLGWDPETQVTRVRCHRKLIGSLGDVFQEIHKRGFWPLLKTFDGCYAWRGKRGVKKLSTHCWGIAIDLNADTNELGQEGDMPPEIVQIFVKHGWTWGGEWERKDPMHFQACGGY